MIIVEGADGTGKSSLCYELSTKLDLSYIKIARHKNDPELNGLRFYMQHAESIPINSVIDRFHIGEIVYPTLYTDDMRSPLKIWEQHAIERILQARGTILIHVIANKDFIARSYISRSDDINYKQIAFECDLFATSVFNSILQKYTYITTHTNVDKFIELIGKYHNILLEKVKPISGYYSTGSVENPIMIVGDEINRNVGVKYAFNAWSGSSIYLHEALNIAGFRSQFYLTNAYKSPMNHENIHALLLENYHINPIAIIALGNNASKLLHDAGLKHTMIAHPSYHKRFINDVYAYAHAIKELII